MKKINSIVSIIFLLMGFGSTYATSMTWYNHGATNDPNLSSVKKTAPDGWNYGGATSQQYIAEDCNGYFEFTLQDWNGYFIGVSTTSSLGYYGQVDLAVYVGGSYFYPHIDDSTHGYTFSYPQVAGNKIRIEKTGCTMTFYYVDGGSVLHEIFNYPYAGDAYAEVFMYYQDATIYDGVMTQECEEDWFVQQQFNRSFNINDNIYTLGNVAVGVDLPTARMDVAGNLRIRQIDQELTPQKILVPDSNGMVNYANVEDVAVKDKDWLKPNNDVSDNINDEIYTNGSVGINVQDPQANLDMLAFCNNQPTFRIHREATCIEGASFGNIIQVEAENGFPSSIQPYMVMRSDGRLGIGTEPGNDTRTKICHTGFGSALAVYKTPTQVGGQITSEIRVGQNGSNQIALSVNDGDCNGPGSPVFEIRGNGTYGMFVSPSDLRFKENVERIEHPLEMLSMLRGVTYTFKKEDVNWVLPEGKQTGLIAQDVEKAIPDAVYNHSSGLKMVNYDKVIPLLVEAINAQETNMKSYDREIASLQEELTELYNIVGLICENKCSEAPAQGTGKDSPSGELLKGIELYQNLPNPFNNSTIIPYYIPENIMIEQASLVVTDITGKIIREFTITEKGRQQVVLDRQELRGGYYAYSLFVNGEKVKTLKAIIK